MSPELVAFIGAGKQLTTLFQPILDAATNEVHGYEALSRGPEDSPLHFPERLFETAADAGLAAELDVECFRNAVRAFAALGLKGRLFVNLTPQGLIHLGRHCELVEETLAAAGLNPMRLVLELTEQAILEDYEIIRQSMRRITPSGIAFAIDDLGAGYSGLRAWSELSPEFVKIDRYFTSEIRTDPIKMEFVRAIVDMARAARATVVAEGVETLDEARELAEAGVDFLQGYLIARPSSHPPARVDDIGLPRAEDLAERIALTQRAVSLLYEQAPLSPQSPVFEVTEIFHRDVSVQALAVVDDAQRPVGIVRRSDLLDLLSIPLRRELYYRRPIATLMDRNPLLVDANLRLEQASRLVVSQWREKAYEQFIITELGRYRGMARMIDLLEQMTNQRLAVARYSNPLTALPGNVPIYDCINGLIRRQQPFVLVQFDVDHFKPFNDFYGYSKGDEALMGLGQIIRRAASPRIDFVGHLGGDDFVVVFRSADWERRVQRVFAAFREQLRGLYHPEHLEDGGIVTTDRYGVERRFPLLSISAAGLVCDDPGLEDAESLAYHLAPLKAEAKRDPGCSLRHCRFSDLRHERRGEMPLEVIQRKGA